MGAHVVVFVVVHVDRSTPVSTPIYCRCRRRPRSSSESLRCVFSAYGYDYRMECTPGVDGKTHNLNFANPKPCEPDTHVGAHGIRERPLTAGWEAWRMWATLLVAPDRSSAPRRMRVSVEKPPLSHARPMLSHPWPAPLGWCPARGFIAAPTRRSTLLAHSPTAHERFGQVHRDHAPRELEHERVGLLTGLDDVAHVRGELVHRPHLLDAVQRDEALLGRQRQ